VTTSEVVTVETSEDWVAFRGLVLEYAASLGFDLDFQDFDDEVEHFDAHYTPPDGIALLAVHDGVPVGSAAVRRFDAESAELKRMWVQPAARGHGLGRALAVRAIDHARSRGYRRVLLDTVDELKVARHIYERLGFREIDPYRPNPLQTARYFGLDLDAARS
jgi:putative acetyltransferase